MISCAVIVSRADLITLLLGLIMHAGTFREGREAQPSIEESRTLG